MKRCLILCLVLLCVNSFAQHNYDSQGTIFSHASNQISIGNDHFTIPSYGDMTVLELFSENSNGAFFKIASGSTNSWVALNTSDDFGNGLYLSNNHPFKFNMGPINFITLNQSGTVSIGTSQAHDDYKLGVGGKIIAEEMKVQLQSAWPDYVFDKNYNLWTIQEVDTYIKEHGHLHNIPSATEVKNEGIQLGEMNAKLLQKIEELTLYIIQQQEDIQELKEKVIALENKK